MGVRKILVNLIVYKFALVIIHSCENDQDSGGDENEKI